MPKVIVIFVGGYSKIDNLIEGVSGGVEDNISHAAMLLLGSTLESTGEKEEHDLYPGVWPHSPTKYIGNPNAKFIEVEVPDLAAGEEKARQLIGTLYGYSSCVKTGVYEIFGVKIPNIIPVMDCSQMDVEVLRVMGLNILPDIPACCIAPAPLYKSIMEDWGGKDVTDQYR